MSLSSIRARVEAATPGPWKRRLGAVYPPEQHAPVDPSLGVALNWPVPSISANSAFIAHARQDIPALLRVAAAAADWLHEEDSFSPYDDSDAHAAVRAIEVAKEALRAALAELEALP